MNILKFCSFKKVAPFILLISLSISFVACPVVTETPPMKIPCDEKIKNPSIYEEIILSDPIIKQLNTELKLCRIRVADCFVNNRVSIVIEYELPKSYSSYGITYGHNLYLVCSKNGLVDLSQDMSMKPAAFDADDVLASFKSKVQKIEKNQGIREFVSKIALSESAPIALNNGPVWFMGMDGSYIKYSFWTEPIAEYLLPNSIEWQQFPEIKIAHTILERDILIGELSRCHIGYSEHHSYTALVHSGLNEPGSYYLRVAVICDNDLKDAELIVNTDGSYQWKGFLGLVLPPPPSPSLSTEDVHPLPVPVVPSDR